MVSLRKDSVLSVVLKNWFNGVVSVQKQAADSQRKAPPLLSHPGTPTGNGWHSHVPSIKWAFSCQVYHHPEQNTSQYFIRAHHNAFNSFKKFFSWLELQIDQGLYLNISPAET